MRMGLKKKILLIIIYLTVSYLLLELGYTLLYRYGVIERPNTAWLFQESGKTVHFDPVPGVYLASAPSRFARITRGEVEYDGLIRGNNRGFPDRDDFHPSRGSSGIRRIVVFGDSFTAAQYLESSWPDVVEELSRETECPVYLLNLSIDGAGLANWWSILMRVVRKEHFEIDGIIFAVYGNNLRRKFTITEHRGYQHHMFGRTDSWNPDNWPKNREEARMYLKPAPFTYILPDVEFNAALESKIHPDLPRPWRPYLLLKLFWLGRRGGQSFSGLFSPATKLDGDENGAGCFQPGQIRLIEEIDSFARADSLPVLVINIPSREGLIDGAVPPIDVLLFAEMLNAVFIDGSTAFSGLNEKEIRSCFFPYDGHWNRNGSDRFARALFRRIQDWICY
jgi:hypothetical protein